MTSKPEWQLTAGYFSPALGVYSCPLCVPYMEGGVGRERVTMLVCDEGHAFCDGCGIDLCMAFDREHQFWTTNEEQVARAKRIRRMAEAEEE